MLKTTTDTPELKHPEPAVGSPDEVKLEPTAIRDLAFDHSAASREERIYSATAPQPTAQGSGVCNSISSARRLMPSVVGVCVTLLTLFAICYSFYFCKPVILPIVGAFLLNFLFSPVVARLNRLGLPNAIGALLILAAALGSLIVLVLFAYDPARQWFADRDENLAIVESKLMSLKEPLDHIRDVSESIDKLASGSGNQESEAENEATGNVPETAPEPVQFNAAHSFGFTRIFLNPSWFQGKSDRANTPLLETEPVVAIEEVEPIPVEVRQPSISKRIFSTTGDVLIGFSLMIVLLFYLLASGDRGLEKLVALMPDWRHKRRTVELTRAIEKSISTYLFTTTLINAGLGAVIGTGLWLIGMPNPVLWGVMAMFLNFFPFIGAFAGAAVVFVVAVVTYDSIGFSLIAPAIYLGANLIEANFVTPVLLGRSVSLHPVWLMIFFVVVSWVWGLGGAIVAVPILAVIKITCDHIEPLMPLGTFLGR